MFENLLHHPQLLTYLLTCLPTYLPTYLLTYLLTDLLTYLLTYLAAGVSGESASSAYTAVPSDNAAAASLLILPKQRPRCSPSRSATRRFASLSSSDHAVSNGARCRPTYLLLTYLPTYLPTYLLLTGGSADDVALLGALYIEQDDAVQAMERCSRS